MQPAPQATGPRNPTSKPAYPPVPRIDSRALLAGGRELVIVHGDGEYRLRLTAQGKLILTK